MAALSSAEFEQLQSQLIAVKTQLYEAKDREARAIKAKDAAIEKLAAAEAKIGGPATDAPSDAHGSNSLSNLIGSVKRSVSQVTNGGNSSGGGGSGVEALEQQLASVRAQATNDVEELREQNVALKMNAAHMHKKVQEMEKQNSTLMAHLSNLEEERQSLAEKREREMRKRQARAEGKDIEDDDDDIEIARAKWTVSRQALETQLSDAQSRVSSLTTELSERDAAASQLRVQLTEEQRNFERMLAKLGEKDEALLRAREESHQMNETIQGLRLAALAAASANQANASPSPTASPTATNPLASITSPKTPSSFRNFINKITEKDAPATPTQAPRPPAPAPAPATPAQPTVSEEANTAAATVASSPAPVSTSDADADTAAPAAAAGPTASPAPSTPARLEPAASSDPSSLESEVASLQSELIQLRIMNEHLISSVQKKDASLQAVRDDGERIMAKLAEKEMQIHALREAASAHAEIARESKRKEAIVAKLQAQLATAQAAPPPSSDSAELRAATDAIAVVNQEFDALKETLENTKDMLFLAETQLIDKQKLLAEQTETISDLRAASDQQERSIEALIASKDRQEADLNEHIDYLEKKCLAEVHEWEAKYDQDQVEAKKAREELQAALELARAELETARANETRLDADLEQLREENAALLASAAASRDSIASLESRLGEVASTAQIETRKRNTLVTELKAALKAELIRSKETAARLKNAEDDIVTLRVMNQHRIAAQGGAPAADAQTTGPANGDASPSPAPLASNPAGPSAPGVEQEVTVALAQKLAELQNDKHTLLKQRAALEEHVELLTHDVVQKKEMIRNLVRRIETGALSTNEQDAMQKTQMFAALTPEARQELFEKMEIILQETTLQNAQYKGNLRSMGTEITKLMAEADELRAEATTLREEIDCGKDELELSVAAAADSAALLRSTEAQAHKVETALQAVIQTLQARNIADECVDALEPDAQATVRQAMAPRDRRASVAPPAAAVRIAATATASPKQPTVAEAPTEFAATPESNVDDVPSPSRADQIAAERQAAAEQEEARRAALLADAEALSAAYAIPDEASSPPVARTSRRQRSTAAGRTEAEE